MNTNKLFKLLTAGAFALLSACGDNAVEPSDNNDSPVQTTATLGVLVKDAITGNPLNASVELSTGAKDKTNAKGFVYFKGVPVGSHRALVETEGYASAVVNPNISSTLAENIYIAKDTTVNATLYPKTASLEGYVLFEDKDGKSKAPTNATIRFTANASLNLLDNVVEVSVSSKDGKFTFENLPVIGANYTLEVLDATANGQTYKTKPYSGARPSLVEGTIVYLPSSFKYGSGDLVELFELKSYTATVSSTGTVELEFSDDIDVAKFKPEQVVISNNIVAEKTVDGNKLTLTPADKWPNSFTVTPSIISVKGIAYSGGSVSILTEGGFDLVGYDAIVKSKDTVFLEFSDKIDVAKFKPSMIYVGTSSGSDNIVAEKIVKGNVVKLFPSDVWPNRFYVRVTTSLISVKGITSSERNLTIDQEGYFEIVKYKTPIKNTDDLVFEFNDDIDEDLFKPSMINFTNVNPSATITFEAEVDGKKITLTSEDKWKGAASFTVVFTNIKSAKGLNYNATKAITVEDNPFSIKYYKSTLTEDEALDTLKIAFTDNIDAAKFKPSMVRVGTCSGSSDCWNNIIAEKLVKNDTLKLVSPNKWPVLFYVSFNALSSVNNKVISTSGSTALEIKTEEVNLSGKQVAGLRLNVNADPSLNVLTHTSYRIPLKWKNLAGATGYKIYAKASAGTKKEEFIFIPISTFTYTDVNDSVTVSVNLDGYCGCTIDNVYYGNNNYYYTGLSSYDIAFANGNTIEFIVQAYNNSSETKVNGAGVAKLVAKDETKPTMSSPSWIQVFSDSVIQWYPYAPAANSCYDADADENYDCEGSMSGQSYFSKFRFDKLKNATASQYTYTSVSLNGVSFTYAGSISFSEPIDTTKVTVTTVKSGTEDLNSRFSVKKGWSADRRYLYLRPEISAGSVDKSNFTFRVQVKGVEDLAGNKFEAKYVGLPNGDKTTNDIDFRFEHLATP